MIKPLRKRHFQIWSVLVILIPLGITGALLVRPIPVTSQLLQPAETVASGKILRTNDKKSYTVNLRGREGEETQLEWIMKSALTVPTAVIYKINPGKKDPESGQLVGRLETGGIYRFALQTDSTHQYHFVLYDFIHQQIIDSINFLP